MLPGNGLNAATAAQGDSSGDNAALVGPSVFVQPMVMYENATQRPTFGFYLAGVIGMGMGAMVQMVQLEPYCYFHLARDLYLGFWPYVELYPSYGFSYYVSAPLYLEWLHTGHYEEDWYYTMRDIASVAAYGGPLLVPSDNGALAAMEGGVQALWGVPLLRSSSVVLSADGGVINANEPFGLGALADSVGSDLYLNGSAGVRWVFPIVKTINRGTRVYADALYGSLFWQTSLMAGRSFVYGASAGDIGDVFTGESGARPDAVATHTAGATLQTGLFKHYLFFRTLSLTCTYELLRGDVAADVSLSF